MIRIDTIWLATEPMDMRAGTETALARVITVFGAAKPHCAYLCQSTGQPSESAGSRRDWCLVGGPAIESRQIPLARHSPRQLARRLAQYGS